MFTKSSDAERQARMRSIRIEIEQICERADSFERILLTIADAEAKRKIEQLVESCRLYANRLSERIRDDDLG